MSKDDDLKVELQLRLKLPMRTLRRVLDALEKLSPLLAFGLLQLL